MPLLTSPGCPIFSIHHKGGEYFEPKLFLDLFYDFFKDFLWPDDPPCLNANLLYSVTLLLLSNWPRWEDSRPKLLWSSSLLTDRYTYFMSAQFFKFTPQIFYRLTLIIKLIIIINSKILKGVNLLTIFADRQRWTKPDPGLTFSWALSEKWDILTGPTTRVKMRGGDIFHFISHHLIFLFYNTLLINANIIDFVTI